MACSDEASNFVKACGQAITQPQASIQSKYPKGNLCCIYLTNSSNKCCKNRLYYLNLLLRKTKLFSA